MAPHFNIAVGDCIDADDIGLSHLVQELRNAVIKMILADLLAVGALERLDPHLLVALFGGDFQWGLRFGDQGFNGLIMNRH